MKDGGGSAHMKAMTNPAETVDHAALPAGSFILAFHGTWSVVLRRYRDGWSVPERESAGSRLLTDSDITLLVASGSIIVLLNPSDGVPLPVSRRWGLENPGRCQPCGGVGLEYVPGDGFSNFACASCKGSGEDESHDVGRYLEWLEARHGGAGQAVDELSRMPAGSLTLGRGVTGRSTMKQADMNALVRLVEGRPQGDRACP